ncbi:MAG TPA: porin family protein [Gemmatimonadales bacterium]|nr:porin family protein [Gemmatimonadales bacterium]
MRFHRPALSILVGCLLLSSAAFAQSGKGTELGLQAGAAFSKPGGADAEDINATYTGYTFGGFARVGVSRNFAVQPELFFVHKGAKQTGSGFSATAKLGYVELPVLLMARFPSGTGRITPRVYGGPAVAFKVSCSLSESGTGATLSSDCEGEFDAKRTDFSLLFGAGLDINHFTVDVRYDLGLIKVDDATDPADLKNRTFYILAGWRFGKGN